MHGSLSPDACGKPVCSLAHKPAEYALRRLRGADLGAVDADDQVHELVLAVDVQTFSEQR